MRNLLLSIFVSQFLLVSGQNIKWEGKPVDFSHGKLKVSENKRFLVFEDGTPFFYLADTGWELFHRLTKQDAVNYLENRRKKGFTVIQAVILAELDGLNTPNQEGNKPLIDNDPEKINEAYFEHVDWIIRKAEEMGMFIALLPTWGDKVDKQWGVGPVIFNPENAAVYGETLGRRYNNFKNIIWVVGGDRRVREPYFAVWDAMAQAIKKHDKNHLMTFHPGGGCSSLSWFPEADWLDFNMIQTGHKERSYAIYKKVLVRDYAHKRTMPVLDGEPRYEDHPHYWQPEVLGWFNHIDIRQSAYWSIFSGACGYAYGCHAIWQMLTPEREPIGKARNTWYDDLDLPGAWDMMHVRNLMESRPFLERIPFQEILLNGFVSETDYIVATQGKNYLMVYLPTGLAAKLDLKKCGWTKAKCWWFNCQTGEAEFIEVVDCTDVKTFKSTTGGWGNDWVLVLDNAEINFPKPGSRWK